MGSFMAVNEERDYIYDINLRVKSDARRRRAESDAILESVYEIIVSSKNKRSAVYLTDEPEE